MSDSVDELSALLKTLNKLNENKVGEASTDKGKKKVTWPDQDHEEGVSVKTIREGDREQGRNLETVPDRDRVDVVQLRQRVRDLEAGFEELEGRSSFSEAVLVAGVALVLVGALLGTAILASGLSDSWAIAMILTSVVLVVLIIGPPAGVLLWRAALRM